MEYDKDLRSIQEARDLLKKAKTAAAALAMYDQREIDSLIKTIADACIANAVPLAKMAQKETGFGKWEDKVLKNLLGSKIVYDYIKDMKTIGILREDPARKITEVAVPVGVVVALIPSTNPTSTVMYKTLISLKAGNAIVISPHPNAKESILATVKIIQEAAKKAGAPENIVQVVTMPSIQATDTLMKSPLTGMILATGGEAMVHAAYSSGNPALGVGPGNGPSYIEQSADIPHAVKCIVDSKTFDNGTICASEQSIITEARIKDQVVAELKRQHCYFMSKEETDKVGRFIMRANNTMNPQIVGKTALAIADMAGITVPQDTLVLITEHVSIGRTCPYSREKLCPILAFFTVNSWQEACETSIKLLENEGTGHTMTMHTNNPDIVREFGKRKPVSRILVNTPGSLGGVGVTTDLVPALTLGCGSIGHSATSDNVGPMNLINIRRVAYGTSTLEDVRNTARNLLGDYTAGSGDSGFRSSAPAYTDGRRPAVGGNMGAAFNTAASGSGFSQADIEAITREVMNRILKG